MAQVSESAPPSGRAAAELLALAESVRRGELSVPFSIESPSSKPLDRRGAQSNSEARSPGSSASQVPTREKLEAKLLELWGVSTHAKSPSRHASAGLREKRPQRRSDKSTGFNGEKKGPQRAVGSGTLLAYDALDGKTRRKEARAKKTRRNTVLTRGDSRKEETEAPVQRSSEPLDEETLRKEPRAKEKRRQRSVSRRAIVVPDAITAVSLPRPTSQFAPLRASEPRSSSPAHRAAQSLPHPAPRPPFHAGGRYESRSASPLLQPAPARRPHTAGEAQLSAGRRASGSLVSPAAGAGFRAVHGRHSSAGSVQPTPPRHPPPPCCRTQIPRRPTYFAAPLLSLLTRRGAGGRLTRWAERTARSRAGHGAFPIRTAR